MPRISKEDSVARREEIIHACELLYEHESFCDITMGKIADSVSFSRANIYNYFQTKEEIFLELLRHGSKQPSRAPGHIQKDVQSINPKSGQTHCCSPTQLVA